MNNSKEKTDHIPLYPIINQEEKEPLNTKVDEALFEEMRKLKAKLSEEINNIPYKVENFKKPNPKKQKKNTKAAFLTNVQNEFTGTGELINEVKGETKNEDYSASVKSLANCVKNQAEKLSPEERRQVIDGTFSRVRSLMVKVLGDKKNVTTLFKPMSPRRINLSGLTGDALFKAKIQNLIMDLDDELNSSWPIANKVRKVLKHNFLENLLTDYNNKMSVNPSTTLSECYIERLKNLTGDENKTLKAGKLSRVAILLSELLSSNRQEVHAPGNGISI